MMFFFSSSEIIFTGSGFVSNDIYLHGFFSSSIKLPSDYSAGVVIAFYVSNNLSNLLIFTKPHHWFFIFFFCYLGPHKTRYFSWKLFFYKLIRESTKSDTFVVCVFAQFVVVALLSCQTEICMRRIMTRLILSFWGILEAKNGGFRPTYTVMEAHI